MMSSLPISVIMPVYNSENCLREAIDSILNQTFRDFELVIVDDCSIDSSAAIIEEYKKIDPRVVAYRQQKNNGIAAARNKGLQLSIGEYIAFMDSDDISMPDRLEKQYRFIEFHPEVGVLGGCAEIVDGIGNHIETLYFPETSFEISWSMCFYDPIINPTVMMKRDVALDAGGFHDSRESEMEYYPEDYDLWVRLSEKTNFYNLHDLLLKLRKHDSNITKTRMESTIKNSLKISQRYINSILGVTPSLDVVAVLWNTDLNKKIIDAPDILISLYKCFRDRKGVSASENKFIKKDVSMRLLTMKKRHPEDPNHMKVFLQALNYHPFILFHVLGTKIKRIWKR